QVLPGTGLRPRAQALTHVVGHERPGHQDPGHGFGERGLDEGLREREAVTPAPDHADGQRAWRQAREQWPTLGLRVSEPVALIEIARIAHAGRDVVGPRE